MEHKDKIIKKFHSHPFYFLKIYFMGLVLIVIGFLFSRYIVFLGVFVIFIGEISRRSESFFIMDSGVGREYNLLSTSRKFISYEKIQNLEVNQSFIANIFGIGDMEFDTAGIDGIELSFKGVANPYELEKIIREKMISK